ncbi:MAG: DUF4421 family protein [Crocinitomicaceae bacterium]|nr:DUF4421 family protein [Crocinitomicaceae bacterium]
MKLLIVILTLICCALTRAQDTDSLAYSLYRNKVVLYSDLGYSSSPFHIKDDFIGGFDKIKYKHNQKVVLGIGVAYKWFSLRLGLALPGPLRSGSKFGNPNYQDLGIAFTIKKTYWDVNFRNYLGYAIQDAYRWDDSLTTLKPNAIESQIRNVSFSINSWYFKSDQFRMQSVFGKVGEFKRSIGTWYLKSTLNLFGVGNSGNPLVPLELIDSTETKSFAHATSALDIGVVPGYAYVYRKVFWQVSVFAGLGGVIQSKFYSAKGITRGILGLAPRIDFRFVAGYSKPKYFFWFTTEFDIKSISHREMKYGETYHVIRLVGGVRLDKKQKEKKRKEL